MTPHDRYRNSPFSLANGQLQPYWPILSERQGNSYTLTVIDYLTGRVEAVPLRDKKADTIQNAFATQLWPRHCIPEVIICNRWTEFWSSCTQMYFKQLCIDQRFSTPLSPETCGKLERFNRTLKSIITKLVNNTSHLWDAQLANSLMAYQNSLSSSTLLLHFTSHMVEEQDYLWRNVYIPLLPLIFIFAWEI